MQLPWRVDLDSVIPAQAGIHGSDTHRLDSRLRGNDGEYQHPLVVNSTTV